MQLINLLASPTRLSISLRILIEIFFYFQRRLYEYVLHAVCSPLRVTDANIPSEELAAHVAQVL